MTPKHRLVMFGYLLFGPSMAWSQAVPPVTPNQLQQLAPEETPRLAPSLRGPVPEAARGPNASARVRVAGGRVTGRSVLPEAEIDAILAPLIGQEVPLGAIEAARVAVVSRYGRAGYPFVTAAIGLSPGPEGAEIVLSVIEGRIVSVKLDGDIGPAGTQVLRFLRPLESGEPTRAADLERALLLAGDVPGVQVRSVLRPLDGGEAGEIELIAQVSRQAFNGYVSLDNRGYRLTGPLQALFSLSANSFTSLGERTELFVLQTQDWEQTFGQVSTEAFLGGSGLRVRLYGGYGYAAPGSALAAIGYRGHTTAAGASLQYPILRSRPLNLFTIGAFDYLDSEVEVGATRRQRQSFDQIRALRFGFDGSALDTFVPFSPGPATTFATARVHRGVRWFDSTGTTDVPGAGRAGSDFGFTKWTGEVSRTQPIAEIGGDMVLSLFGVVAGQWSNDVLPLAEKYYFGGNRLGRGFYSGQVTGDRALALSAELQLDVRMPTFQLPDLFGQGLEAKPVSQFYAFRDYGRMRENSLNDPDRRAESWGLGVRTVFNETVQFDLEGVRRLTRRVDAAGSNVAPLAETAGFFRALVRF